MKTLTKGIILDVHVDKLSHNIVLEFDRMNTTYVDLADKNIFELLDKWEVEGIDRRSLKEKLVGRKIVYLVDEFGYLADFAPFETWIGPKIPYSGRYFKDNEEIDLDNINIANEK